MALKPCRECKAAISSRAKVCPHCGLKRPHDLAIQHGLNSAAGAFFKVGCALIVLAFVAVLAVGALGGDHRHVAGDQLWVKECFILQAPETVMWNHRHVKTAGAWSVPKGNIICVKGVDHEGARPWFKVLVMKMGTLDSSSTVVLGKLS